MQRHFAAHTELLDQSPVKGLIDAFDPGAPLAERDSQVARIQRELFAFAKHVLADLCRRESRTGLAL